MTFLWYYANCKDDKKVLYEHFALLKWQQHQQHPGNVFGQEMACFDELNTNNR